MAAIAFDIGDSFCKIGAAKDRKISVMQNQVGKRKTASVVSFTSECRLYDQEAVAQQLSNSKNTCASFKGLVGAKAGAAEVEVEKDYITQELAKAKNGSLGLKVKYLNKDHVFTPTQIVASLMVFLKDQAEKGIGSKLPDCVIGVPPHWTEKQRHAFLDAAKLVGISVSRLMNETTAVALDYGMNLELDENSSKKSLIIDVGHSNVNVSAVEFWRKNGRNCGLKVLATASAKGIGARSFSNILVKYLSEYCLKKYKLDVNKNSKARMKIKRECESIKTNLTANNKVPFGIEYLMDGQDISGSIERKEFEEAAIPLLKEIVQPVRQIMQSTGLTPSELSTVEVVGGGSRIPCVKKALREAVGMDLSYHCDADESCCKGLVLQAAMLSSSFRTRDYQVEDISPHEIEIAWGPLGSNTEEDKTIVFTANNPIPSTKLISFSERTQPFQLIARYTKPVHGAAPEISRHVISGFPKQIVGEKTKVKVWMKMSLHGTVEVEKAQLVETLPLDESAMEEEVAETTEAEEQREASKKEGAKSGGIPTEESKEEGQKTDEPKKDEKKQPKALKKKYNRANLKVESFTFALPGDDFKKFENLEAEMFNTDRVVAETAALRNDLETYALEMRSKVRGELKSYIAPEAATKFLEQLQNAEDWIYDEGYDAQKSTLVAKLNELKVTGDPIFKRQYEYSNNGELVERLKMTLGKYRQLATSGDKKYAHIEKKDLDSIVSKCEEFDTWATNAAVTFGSTPHHQDPSISCGDIKKKQQEFVSFAQPILSTPAPAPKREEKKGTHSNRCEFLLSECPYDRRC